MNTLRILLIDDDAECCERVANRLEAASHTVLPLLKLEEAAQALHVQRFDAVVLPFRMADPQLRVFVDELRALENAGRSATRVPVIAYTGENDAEAKVQVDAFLPPGFDANLLTEAVSRLAASVRGVEPGSEGTASADLPVFRPSEFTEQMGFDQSLVVEIIDLFLNESMGQLRAMQQALADSNFTDLGNVAHTIKGSFGSLYATRAASHAQTLELAAKSGNARTCQEALDLVASDLDVLKPELLRLRNAGL